MTAEYVCQYCNNRFKPGAFVKPAEIKCPKCKDKNCSRVKVNLEKLNYYPAETKETKEQLQKAFEEMLDWNID